MSCMNIAIFLICNVLLVTSSLYDDEHYSPLIIIPGFAGSRGYFQSPTQSKPHLIWLHPTYIITLGKLVKYLQLRYNSTSHTTYSPWGYKYVTQGWGDTYTIESLNNHIFKLQTDYHGMINEILKIKYYKRNVTLRAAPFDFRKAPNEMKEFFDKLKLLVEDTYRINGNRRIVLLGHSLGCMYSLSFIHQMDNPWKKKYIKSFVSVSGPLGGAVKDLMMQTTGVSVVIQARVLTFREFERTFPSSLFMIPKSKYFNNMTLVQTDKRKYTAFSYQDLFKDMGYDDGYSMYNDVKNLVDGSKSPTGIDNVYCIHGQGIDTLESYILTDFESSASTKKFGPGDGTVNKVSLEICRSWNNVKYTVIDGANHKNILHNNGFVKLLNNILSVK